MVSILLIQVPEYSYVLVESGKIVILAKSFIRLHVNGTFLQPLQNDLT